MGLFSKNPEDLIVTQLAEHQSALLAFIYTLIPGDASVNDVLQRTNLVIWKKRQNFEKGTNFKSWAFSIAHWEVRAYLKECKRKSWLIVDEELCQKLSNSMTHLVEEKPFTHLSGDLELCIQSLRPQDQDLIQHRYYSGQPLKDFSEKTGRPVNSLKTTLSRIRIALRKCIEARIAIQFTKH